MAVEFRFPDIGSGITEGEVVKIYVKDGDTVKEDETLFEIETAKAVVQMPSPAQGVVLKINVRQGETIKVGDILAVIGNPDEKIEDKTTESKSQIQIKKDIAPSNASSRIVATPHTRRLAKELGVELNKIKGTGHGGRITDEDVSNYAKGTTTSKTLTAQITRAPFESYGKIQRIPIHGVRKTIMDRIQISATVPTVTHTDEADITNLVKIRDKKKKLAENMGIKLTYLPFITKAVIIGLREHPHINTSIDESTNEIIIKKYYNIGIAVDTIDGLIVPVIKSADRRSVLQLASDMEKLSGKARNRTLTIDELQGGSFTITNLGTFGGIFFTPILNYPESAILGIGKIIEKPRIEDKKILIRKILPLSLTYDHRVIDGAQAAKFLNTVIKHLEDPDLMLVDE